MLEEWGQPQKWNKSGVFLKIVVTRNLLQTKKIIKT